MKNLMSGHEHRTKLVPHGAHAIPHRDDLEQEMNCSIHPTRVQARKPRLQLRLEEAMVALVDARGVGVQNVAATSQSQHPLRCATLGA